ncbi:unnamed protein product [Rotaria sp. Silwood1]|nr:unnamed protein product [Rotaria sp. Silwood1]CAF1311601.1 unnamed protein product [Rotaria sp. Silwood1]CAF3550309.1 unnamed protein product [Rotaria sp. Silwood1]CAF4803132.1 unnamed protein product [Rotaria sp. Silwood1]
MVGIDAKNKNILDQKSKFKCPQCQKEIQRNQAMIDRGFKSDMLSLPIDCTFCNWTGDLNSYQNHLNQSHSKPICEYCKEEFNSTNNLNEHKLFRCKQITTDCLLKDYGCNEQILRCEMASHYLSKQHQDSVIKVVHQMKSQFSSTQMDTDISQTTTAQVNNRIMAHLQEFYETLNILCGGIETLNDDEQRLNNESLQYQIIFRTLLEDFSRVKLAVEETNSFLEGFKLNQDIIHQDVISLKQNIDDMQYISYDGTFIWKITGFREKMRDAQSERQTSIYSPPFYSSPTGYKMRARLYLYGDGNARRTHISLFFVLMRGLNDAILKFPFNYKVTFCLYDQTSQQRHIIDSFRPDIKSNSFQRPKSEMNIASGIPKFCPLAMIEQEDNPYIRDDTMFIKILIDFGDMPKTLLPYALSLNPGIPMHIQQMMIKQEAERRAP